MGQTALQTKERFYLVDGIRGLALVNMVLFHLLFDVFVIYGFDPGWAGRLPVRVWERFICCTFILISGMAWHWGKRHNLKRGLLLNLYGLAITLVTWIAVPQQAVWCGILTFLGCAVLLMIPLDRLFCRVPPLAGVLVSLAALLVFWPVNRGWLGIGNWQLWPVPQALYQIRPLVLLGFPFEGFSSSDYFSLLPWFFLFCAGYFLEPLLRWDKFQTVGRVRIPILTKIGQKSIWIYLVHQPVCMLLCMAFLEPGSPLYLLG